LKTYSDEFKNSIVVKLLPPHNVSVPQWVKETGITRNALYGWRRQAGSEASLPATPAAPVGSLSSAKKFSMVVETAILNERELGEPAARAPSLPMAAANTGLRTRCGSRPTASRAPNVRHSCAWPMSPPSPTSAPTRSSPALADLGRYLASGSTFFRMLRAADQLARRSQPKSHAACVCSGIGTPRRAP
jgi:transposase-like protein